MGCFSWKFADTDNQQRLRIGHRGYLALPDGNFLCADSYEGYGEFDGRDVYELVVWWNREYIAKNPDAEVKAYSITLHDYAPKKLKDFWWYPVIADPSLIGPEVNRKLKELDHIVVSMRSYVVSALILPVTTRTMPLFHSPSR